MITKFDDGEFKITFEVKKVGSVRATTWTWRVMRGDTVLAEGLASGPDMTDAQAEALTVYETIRRASAPLVKVQRIAVIASQPGYSGTRRVHAVLRDAGYAPTAEQSALLYRLLATEMSEAAILGRPPESLVQDMKKWILVEP